MDIKDGNRSHAANVARRFRSATQSLQ